MRAYSQCRLINHSLVIRLLCAIWMIVMWIANIRMLLPKLIVLLCKRLISITFFFCSFFSLHSHFSTVKIWIECLLFSIQRLQVETFSRYVASLVSVCWYVWAQFHSLTIRLYYRIWYRFSTRPMKIVRIAKVMLSGIYSNGWKLCIVFYGIMARCVGTSLAHIMNSHMPVHVMDCVCDCIVLHSSSFFAHSVHNCWILMHMHKQFYSQMNETPPNATRSQLNTIEKKRNANVRRERALKVEKMWRLNAATAATNLAAPQRKGSNFNSNFLRM